MKNFILILVAFVLLACQNSSEKLTKIFDLPKKLKEVSGIVYTEKDNLFWVLEDSGNPSVIYGLDTQEGKIQRKLAITEARNGDWEDITKDVAGNLYIGDFGNNGNKRKDLCIYKIDKNALDKDETIPSYKVSFSYPEQKEFPPKKSELFFDAESFFEYKGNFYLFTKNRSKGYDGTVFVYKIPNVAGNHQALLIGKFKTCDNYRHCVITSAAISPDASKIVFLAHDKVFLFENYKEGDFLNGTQTELKLNNFSQKEAICFKDNKTLIIAEEKGNLSKANVYEITLEKLKSVP
ncbi:hypothetical protein [Flavobacterium sp.]|uniref:hypothetical protein n=1 Tax=Flavobacterium sp. TaxID=239 RepID=UPI002C2BE626|nr:hypothetical protein [Flavobacterium sp.]HSD06842.1 hypothetical protein [Flavobacterium sp.]